MRHPAPVRDLCVIPQEGRFCLSATENRKVHTSVCNAPQVQTREPDPSRRRMGCRTGAAPFLAFVSPDSVSIVREGALSPYVEAGIESLIDAKARQAARDPKEREEPWMQRERANRERRRRDNRIEWIRHHESMADLHACIAADHEAAALRLLNGGGRVVAGLNDRLRRLEAREGGNECPDCGFAKGVPGEAWGVEWFDEEGDDPQPEWCATCGEQITFVVGFTDLDDEDPGEGGS